MAIGLIAIACEDSEACRQDAECWGQKHWVDAETKCAPFVEARARYNHDWTTGFLGRKFGQWHWADKETGIVVYRGSSIKFQNGFGAWEQMSYECDYDTETKTVVTVSVY